MRKILLGILIAIVVLGLSGVATAGILIPVNDKAKEKGRADNSPVIETDEHWSLTSPGLEKIVFIHYKKGFAKPPWAGGGDKSPKESKCYEFLGRGVKWSELPVNYVIHPDLEAVVPGAIFTSAETWDAATGAELFSDSYVLDATATWDSDSPDGRNELLFGDYPQGGVIAVTVIWGYFSGPPQTRKIVEFDILFDTDWAWGDATVNPEVMDLQNIATHELGHGIGLGDLYETSCVDETMYGYSSYGETKKRDLNTGDITGVQELYGL